MKKKTRPGPAWKEKQKKKKTTQHEREKKKKKKKTRPIWLLTCCGSLKYVCIYQNAIITMFPLLKNT